ncbi:MAG TPA: cation-transporting P-type ATPase [Roseiflexaceae bacterium]|nr:cation-transporting P-type ATPase [Roseiflexaceae bacterium]
MLDQQENGLTEAEAAARLAQFGPNRLAEERGETLWAKVLEELREPMILLLLITGALYALLGEPSDAITIALIIATLLTIEIANERRAARAVAALRALAEPTAAVRRAGSARELPSEQVVPGDLLLLQAGRRVPADARLAVGYGLAVDEAALTGESLPVEKHAGAPEERSRQVFAGTTVVRGRGAALVTATGPATELGRVAGLARAARPPRTALQLAMRHLSGALVWVALAFSVLIPLLGVLVARQPPEQMLLTGLSLAFATIPEELPIIITMVLALGAYRLSRQRAVVKRLQAVESLGAITVVATDKTGTLTENRMALRLLDPPERAQELLELGLLASTGSQGDPLEAGLARAAGEAGLDGRARQALRLRDEHSFDAGRRLVSLVYETDSGLRIAAKGAPEAVLARADRWAGPAGIAPLDEARRRALLERAAALAGEGLRVIALAERSAPPGPLDREDAERGLVFAGLAAFSDPPRPEAAAAVAACRAAGIRTLMITGDHPQTARAVAAEIGLGRGERLLTGAELDILDDGALEQAVAQVDLYARATPEHKLRIVQALQRRGERVAVTGDGINDAPALAAADIGIAMGASGTDVARAAAGMILADDNFATLGAALREGRALFANLHKGVRYYLACKVALISAALLPTLLGMPTPFAPVQIILLELFMDVAAAAAFVAEPAEPGSMAQPPRDPRAPFLDRALIVAILVAGLGLGVAVSFAHLSALWAGAELAQAQTAAFFTWLLGHMLLALNLRTERAAVLRLRVGGNRVMAAWALATVAFVLLAASVPPLGGVLRTAPLGGADWLRVTIAATVGASWLGLYQLALPARPAPDSITPAARSS